MLPLWVQVTLNASLNFQLLTAKEEEIPRKLPASLFPPPAFL